LAKKGFKSLRRFRLVEMVGWLNGQIVSGAKPGELTKKSLATSNSQALPLIQYENQRLFRHGGGQSVQSRS
jgi:hypothetical protein